MKLKFFPLFKDEGEVVAGWGKAELIKYLDGKTELRGGLERDWGLKFIIDIVANHAAWDSVLMQHPKFYKQDANGKIVPAEPSRIVRCGSKPVAA